MLGLPTHFTVERKQCVVLLCPPFPSRPHSVPRRQRRGQGPLEQLLSLFLRGSEEYGGEGLCSAAGPWLLWGGKDWGEQGQTKPAGPAVCANSGLGHSSAHLLFHSPSLSTATEPLLQAPDAVEGSQMCFILVTVGLDFFFLFVFFFTTNTKSWLAPNANSSCLHLLSGRTMGTCHYAG